MAFAQLKVVPTGGTVEKSADGGSLNVTGANSVVLLYSCDTSYVDGLTSPKYVPGTITDPEPGVREAIENASKKSVSEILEAHLADYRSLFRTMYLEVDGSHTLDYIKAFQYARYEMIVSSRDTTITRAGYEIPNDRFHHQYAAWNISWSPQSYSAHFLNENVEKFFGSVETTNMSSLAEPLMRWIEELAQNGAKTAKSDFGFRGWMAPHYSDAWASTSLKFGSNSTANEWGMWPMGGTWLCNNVWDHYDFSRDLEDAEQYYELLKGCSLFCLDYLQYDPKTGFYSTSPSTSPENQHASSLKGEANNGRNYALDTGSTVDVALVREVFKNTLKLAYVTGQYETDTEFIAEIENMLPQLLPYQIGMDGQIQEYSQDYNNATGSAYNPHRHASELLTCWPLSGINKYETPVLNEAAIRTLELRGTGGYHPDRNAMWARMGEGDNFDLDSYSATPNSNSGVGVMWGSNLISGFPELFVQSDNGYIELLPALPSAMQSGRVCGIRARGNYTIDLEWENGELVSANIDSPDGVVPRIMYKGEFITDEDPRINLILGEANMDKIVADASALLAENYTQESKDALKSAIDLRDQTAINAAIAGLEYEKPYFTNETEYSAMTGQELTINLNAQTDSNSDQKFIYYIADLPEYAELDKYTGELTWTPVNNQAGTTTLSVMANNGVAESSIDITIDVEIDENYVDKEELKDKLDEALAIDTKLYTEESVAVLTEAIENAAAAIDNSAATKADVKNAILALESAIANLVEDESVTVNIRREFESADGYWGDYNFEDTCVGSTRVGTTFAFYNVELDGLDSITANMSTNDNNIVLGVYVSDAEIGGAEPELTDADKIGEIVCAPTGSWTNYTGAALEVEGLSGTGAVFVRVLSSSGNWGGNYDSIDFGYRYDAVREYEDVSAVDSIVYDTGSTGIIRVGSSQNATTDLDGNTAAVVFHNNQSGNIGTYALGEVDPDSPIISATAYIGAVDSNATLEYYVSDMSPAQLEALAQSSDGAENCNTIAEAVRASGVKISDTLNVKTENTTLNDGTTVNAQDYVGNVFEASFGLTNDTGYLYALIDGNGRYLKTWKFELCRATLLDLDALEISSITVGGVECQSGATVPGGSAMTSVALQKGADTDIPQDSKLYAAIYNGDILESLHIEDIENFEGANLDLALSEPIYLPESGDRAIKIFIWRDMDPQAEPFEADIS